MSRNIFIIIAVVVGVGLGFYFFSSSGANYPVPKNPIIVAFGDSLIAGQGATEGRDFISLVSRKLNRPIINLGHPGDTTTAGIARINTVFEEDPGTVILLLGGNDFLKKVPQTTTEQNLRTIISELKKRGIVVVLLGVRGGIILDDYKDMYERLAKEFKLPYVSNVLSGIITKREYMSDSVHPNDRGYAVIAERVYEVMKEIKL